MFIFSGKPEVREVRKQSLGIMMASCMCASITDSASFKTSYLKVYRYLKMYHIDAHINGHGQKPLHPAARQLAGHMQCEPMVFHTSCGFQEKEMESKRTKLLLT